ncbi:mandelate racemase muconate lactonizing protein [Levilactobacillus zymae DSM 19395]|nr:mandelate racemase/muconate lactonizing enzyme family protein [Levilactobacillus zymae]KRL15621.1 mandelate racemase muconate lactonizing protein [Levilactobacillus zymae DSM 19395]
MDVSVVAIETDVQRDGQPVIGYGFNSNGRYAQSGIIHKRMIPRIMQAQPADYLTADGTNLDPFKLWKIMMTNEKPGGHGERSVAVGTIDMAIWDAVAKIEEKPLYRLLSERYGDGHPDDRVFVYAAGGYYQPGKDDTLLQQELKGYLDQGYSVVKMKIGNGLDEDRRRIEAALKVVPSGKHLAVDANGRLDLKTALEYAKMLAPYDLFWFEEAGDPLDFKLQHELSQHYAGTMATGENLFSMQDARNLIRYGGMRPQTDYLQFDCALSYGLVEYMKTLKMLRENGWSSRRCIPHGGHQMSLNIAAGLKLGGNESYPGIFEPFGGFADNLPIEDGYVRLPQVPGIGFETKAALMKVLREVAQS